MDKYIVGKIINTFGIKGEVKVEIITDFKDQRFKPENYLYINDLKVKIKKVRYHKGFALITFYDYEDINLVENFKNNYLYVSKKDLHRLEDGYYFYQLLNLDVFIDDNYIGKVNDVEYYPANNVLRVKNDKKIVLIPFVKSFIKNVDIKNKRIDVYDVEGLL